eukprot:TRINITY_DN4524_c0_g1_i1.p1 TRINITY_DN4524_c0_g1~~TRINITY_DN4524_c0_g1_i1.p1  ORF type:complete len:755 (+),score=221.68 TRINITY_DN4524_c0_g1_i1:359-2623(+)
MGKKSKKPANKADDDDALLSAYVSAEDDKHKAEVVVVKEVSPRANAAITSGADKMWVLGGECFVGDETMNYDDVLYYDIPAGEWNQVKPAGKMAPCARNGHVCCLVNGALFMYGGEYTSKNGIDIFHLGDLWRLDLEHLRWNEITSAKVPSSRSACRMVAVSEDSFLIFGGYHDNGSKLKKFNDLYHVTSTAENKTTSRLVKADGAKPPARSGCCLGATGSTACVYGGTSSSGNALGDMWVIDTAAATPVWRELEFSRNGLTPRSGIVMTMLEADQAVFFGGLSETAVDTGKKKKKKVVIQHNDTWTLDLAERSFKEVQSSDPEDKARPSPRYSAGITSCKGAVYVFGGVLEVDKGQTTLGDLWRATVQKGKVKWTNLMAANAVLGCDESDSESESVVGSVVSGVDDAQTDDGLPYGYGVEEPLRVCRRLTEYSKGAVGQFNAWHYAMMNDTDRNAFYKRGLAKCVEGKVVFDIGSGAGLLSLLSAKLGAKKVVGCEVRSELASLANDLISRNDFEKKAGIISRVSVEITKDDFEGAQPDVIVHELFGALLLGERSLKFVAEARDRLGVKHVVPRRGVQYATLIYSKVLKEITGINNEEGDRLGLDLSACDVLKDTCGLQFTKSMGIDMGAVVHTKLSERVPICSVDYLTQKPGDVPVESEYEVKVTEAGEVTAVLLTWEAFNDDDAVALSTEPGVGGPQRAAAWGQAYQLIEAIDASSQLPKPVKVAPGTPTTLFVRYSKDLATLQCEVATEE